MLRYSQPPGYRLNQPRLRPKLDRFGPLIDQMLEDDRLAPSKQRHTAKRILLRLQEEHSFVGSYTIVKDYVREQRLRDFPVADVRQAMERALQYGAVTFESVKMLVLSGREPSFEAVRLSAGRLAGLPKVHIAAADPSCYRALLAGGVA